MTISSIYKRAQALFFTGGNMIEKMQMILTLIISLANLCVLMYGLYKFTKKPHDTLRDEVDKLKSENTEIKVELKDIHKSLDASFEKHRDQDKTNAVFKKVMLLFANFEIAFCLHTDYKDTSDLMKAKEELNDYLTGK